MALYTIRTHSYADDPEGDEAAFNPSGVPIIASDPTDAALKQFTAMPAEDAYRDLRRHNRIRFVGMVENVGSRETWLVAVWPADGEEWNAEIISYQELVGADYLPIGDYAEI